MILDALHTTINPILPAFPAIGDISAVIPFAVFKAEQQPIRTKDGIVGYNNKVSVALVDDDTDRLETKTVAVRAAIEALTGTINSTRFNRAIYTGETGIDFDPQTNTYQNAIDFDIDTDNR